MIKNNQNKLKTSFSFSINAADVNEFFDNKRICILCKWRETDCKYSLSSAQSPKQLFGINNNEILPEIINGVEVAEACPFFEFWKLKK